MSMNQVSLMGRLVKDPEIRTIGKETSVCNFTLAVDRNYVDEDGNRPADFIGCVAWRGTAEFLGKHFHKGDPVAVTGSIQARSYDDEQDNRHWITEVVVDQVFFCGSRKPAEDKPKEAPAKRDKYGYKKTAK